MQPYARGVYVNYLGVGDSAERVRAAYGPEKYARLAALKREVRPGEPLPPQPEHPAGVRSIEGARIESAPLPSASPIVSR